MKIDRENWAARTHAEVAFWGEYMRTGGLEWPEDMRERLDPDAPLQEVFRALINVPEEAPVDILDVGAGPFTSVGKRWIGHDVRIVAIDPLGDEYNRLLVAHGLSVPVRTEQADGEDVAIRFAPRSFDCAFARNSLDHAYDPLRIIDGMLAVVKSGGVVVLSHAIREADTQRHEGLHQWNLYAEAGCFWIEGAGEHVNVTELVADVATTAVTEEGGWVHVAMRKRLDEAVVRR